MKIVELAVKDEKGNTHIWIGSGHLVEVNTKVPVPGSVRNEWEDLHYVTAHLVPKANIENVKSNLLSKEIIDEATDSKDQAAL